MAKKEELKQGLANLISGADRSVSRAKDVAEATEKAQATEEATPEEAAPQMEVEPTTLQDETDLINSVEDVELRKELERRLRQKRMRGRGRPRKNDQNGNRTDGYERTSMIIPKVKWEKIKEIAFIETLTLKEIVELALDLVIERYESKHGEITIAERPKKDINEIF